MHDVQTFAVPKPSQIRLDSLNRELRSERHKTVQAEDRVVKIAPARAILKPAILIELIEKKIFDQPGRFAKEFRCKPRHLKHFETEAHESTPRP
jgi:hypothetical protein